MEASTWLWCFIMKLYRILNGYYFQEDVIILDSPGVDVDTDFDEW